MKFYPEYITKLEAKEVFVFGSNLSGFHGAGSAGFASFNEVGNVWRKYNYDKLPHGWRGKWNVKGVGEGFQIGTDGWSYAIPTVTHAGKKQSRTIEEISVSIKSLYAFAISKPSWKFFVAQDAKIGLNGHSPEVMAKAFSCMQIPENIFFYKPFYNIIKNVVSA